jgi:glycosyltransferase involved in cell wall biosynthesis
MSPFFSIITPTYNRAELLRKTIESVLTQEFNDWELIISDDASKDHTIEVAKSYHDLRIKYIKSDINRHQCGARNLAFSLAKGKYICYLDDDDYYYPNHLSALYNEIKNLNSPIGVFYTGHYEDKGHGPEKHIMKEIGDRHPLPYICENYVIPSRTCFHREILEKHKWNEEIRFRVDIEMWSRILVQYPFYYVPEHTVVEVFHPNNMNNRKYNVGPGQIKTMELMFSNPQIKKLTGKDVRHRMYQGSNYLTALYYERTGEYFKMLKPLIKSIYYQPSHQFKAKMVMILYNMPLFGKVFKKLKAQCST